VPFGRSQSTSTMQHGTTPTIRAATPDATRSSDHTTKPLPNTSSSTPTIAVVRHSARVGAAAPPKTRANAYSIVPATRNRVAAMKNGGSVSIANRIARYVEPHTR
jgi:hypothetical protein